MAVIGGAIIEITWNHPTLGAGRFYPKGDEDATIDTGGMRTDDDDNGLDGSGQMIKVMTQKRWSVEATVANDMIVRKDLENASALASNPEDADLTFTHISGTIYGGKGTIVGDVKASSKDATLDLKFSGSGKLAQL